MKATIFSFLLAFLGLSTASAQDYREMMADPNANFYDIQKAAYEWFDQYGTGKGSGYKQFKRWEHHMEERVYPSGELINNSSHIFDEYYNFLAESASFGSRGFENGGTWRPFDIDYFVNPNRTEGMGRVNCVAVAERSPGPDAIYIGCPEGGLWRTEDNGVTWDSLTDGLPVQGISGIAIHPTNEDIIYILTGDGDGANTWSIGVLKSENGGETWMTTGLSLTTDVRRRGFKLLMHPSDPETLFACMSDGLYRTTDGGVNWTRWAAGHWFWDIEFLPNDPDILFAINWDGNLARTTDRGDTWSYPENNGIPQNAAWRGAIAVSPDEPDWVYVIHSNNLSPEDEFAGIYRSIDQGVNFTERSRTPNILGWEEDGMDQGTQARFDLALEVNPDNANEVHVGGINCWRSRNGGTTWELTSDWSPANNPTGYTHADIHNLAYFGQDLYCASDGGIFRSVNDADDWVDLSSGLRITQIYRFAGTQNTDNLILAGAQDNGVIRWTGGTTFDQVRGGDGSGAMIDPTNSQIVYSISGEGTIQRSTDQGNSFNAITTPIKPNFTDSGDLGSPAVMHPNNPQELYVAYEDVYHTTNSGGNWVSLNQRLPPPNEGRNTYDDLAIGLDGNGDVILYAASDTDIRRFNESTGVWTDIRAGLPWQDAAISGLTISDIDPERIWVCFSGYEAAHKVYTSSDGGDTWANITDSDPNDNRDELPNFPMTCMIYQTGPNNAIYLGSEVGVFYRDDNIGHWEIFNNGLPCVEVTDMEIQYGNTNELRVSTFGRGLWFSDLWDNCEANKNLTDQGVVGVHLHQASNEITSNELINGGVGTHVIYQADNSIVLNPGFEAIGTSSFLAEIEDCHTAPVIAHRDAYAGPMPGVVEPIELQNEDPEENSLSIFPNPTSGQVFIDYEISEEAPLYLDLVDQQGRVVEQVVNQTNHAAGTFRVSQRLDHLANGIYFFRLRHNDRELVKKVVLEN